nr:synaptosomal associated protein 29 [Hymenolepis microstoma]
MPANPFGEDNNTSTNPFDTNNGYSESDMTFATPQSRTLASQQRALASIGLSERVGISTLEELAEQGEKLDRAEQRLHEIGELQKDGQKQIGALQNWWKSWFTKKPDSAVEPLNKVLPTPTKNQDTHASSFLSQNANSVSTSIQQKPPQASTLNQPRSQFDANMDMMSSGMARLKSMATVMNAELKAQNKQLDRMDPQLARVSDTMTTQNRQMNKLLGVKNPP